MAEPFGRYQLLKRLASGGMGEVFLARQSGIQGFEKLLVIKTLLPNLTEDSEFVQMFLDEARIAARLAHPNVVQIFDLGEEQSIFYIAMEFVHGEDVKRIWRQAYHLERVIPVPLAARIVSDAAAGLGYAHRLVDQEGNHLGLVHRDVSPQNILVTFDGGVKLIDFGVAKAAGRMTKTQTGALKGKYAYMSPEQVDGQELDNRSDVFALGIVLWEMVTGSRLFRADSDVQTLKAVSKCEVVPPSEQNPVVPPSLDAVVLKALARDRDQRYPTADAFRLDLENWIASTQAQASAAHLAEFMRDLFKERLATEGTKGPLADIDPNATGFSPFGPTSAGRPPRKSESTSGSKSLVRSGPNGEISLVQAGGRPPWMWPVMTAGGVAIGGLLAWTLWPKPPPAVVPIVQVPPPVPAPTELTVTTDPPGASVRIDGRESGVTPMPATSLPSGQEVRLEVSKTGYQPEIQHLKLVSGPLALQFKLQVMAAPKVKVMLESDPSGADVFLGDQKVGTTPYAWQTDQAQVPTLFTFKARGYRPHDERVTPDNDHQISVALAKAEHHGGGTNGKTQEPSLEIKTGR